MIQGAFNEYPYKNSWDNDNDYSDADVRASDLTLNSEHDADTSNIKSDSTGSTYDKEPLACTIFINTTTEDHGKINARGGNANDNSSNDSLVSPSHPVVPEPQPPTVTNTPPLIPAP